MPPTRTARALKASKPAWYSKPTMKLNAPRNLPQINYCNPNQQVSKPRPKERLQLPPPSRPIAPTHQGPAHDQLASEVKRLRARTTELERERETKSQMIDRQKATIYVMDRTIAGLKANNLPAPRTPVQLHRSHPPQAVQQQPTPTTSPDNQLPLFNMDYDFGAYQDPISPIAPITSNGQFIPYAHHPSASSFGVSTYHNDFAGPLDPTAANNIFHDYSMAQAPQPYPLPTASAPIAYRPKPTPLPLKAANKPAPPIITAMATAPAAQPRQATPAAQPLETGLEDGIFDFLNEDIYE